MTWLVNITLWILSKLFGKSNAPSAEAVAAKDEGNAQVQAAGAEQALATETAIAQAEVDAPESKADVVSALQKGEF